MAIITSYPTVVPLPDDLLIGIHKGNKTRTFTVDSLTGVGSFLSLTTEGTSGAATLNNGVLNIPIYTGSPGSVTSVGLSSNITAFSVGSSPITSSGTISLNRTGGTSGQFLRQDGTWATVPATDLTGYQITSEKGNADGYAPLDTNNKVPTIHLPAAILGSVIYQGTWDAAADLPNLPSPTGVKGYYYVVSNPGTYSNGITYALGDWIISNGIDWEKVDNSAGVNSVNGATGTVSLGLTDLSDVAAGGAGQVLTSNGNGSYDFQTPDPGVGTTDLTNTPQATLVTIESSTGNNTTIAAASATIAGVMTAADKIKLNSAPTGGTDLYTARTQTKMTIDSSTGASTTLNEASVVLAGVMTAADKTKLDSIGSAANYVQNSADNFPRSAPITQIVTLTQTEYNNITPSSGILYIIL